MRMKSQKAWCREGVILVMAVAGISILVFTLPLRVWLAMLGAGLIAGAVKLFRDTF